MVILFLVLAESKIGCGREGLAIIPLFIIQLAIKTIFTDMISIEKSRINIRDTVCELYFRYVSRDSLHIVSMILIRLDQWNNTHILGLASYS